MSTFHGHQTDRRGLRNWSRTRWLAVMAVLLALIVGITLIIVYSGGSGSSPY